MVRVVLASLVLAVAACGGAATPSSGGATASAAASAAPSPSATKAAAVFADVVRAGANASYKISYKYSASVAGQTQTFDQTWYAKGALMRWDLATLDGNTSFFFLADGAYVCLVQGQPVCLKIGGASSPIQEPPSVQVQDQVRASPDRFDAQPRPDRAVAGVMARCFDIQDKGTTSIGKGTMCYSPQGLPLYTQFTAATGSFTMEATAIGTPSDADFTLFAPVRTLP